MEKYIKNNYITLEDDNFFMCTDKIPKFKDLLFTISGDKLAYLDVFPNAILSFGENSKSVYVTNDIRKVFALHERGVNNIVFVYELTHSFAKEIMDKFTVSDIVLLDDFGDETSYFTFFNAKRPYKNLYFAKVDCNSDNFDAEINSSRVEVEVVDTPAVFKASNPPEGHTADDRILTGFPKLDKCFGGMGKGEASCISGATGEGKSTIANQIAVNAAMNGNKVLIYSGETEGGTLARLLSQVAAENKDIDFNSRNNDNTYNIFPEARDNVNLLLENIHCVDNCQLEDFKLNEIIEFNQKSADKNSRYDLIIIDNLMSAASHINDRSRGSGEKTYEYEEPAAEELIRLAQKYKFALLLICHQKKAGDFSIDSIYGSSEIFNKMAFVATYARIDKLDSKSGKPPQGLTKGSFIHICKNRTKGFVHGKTDHIFFEFDEKTRKLTEYIESKGD